MTRGTAALPAAPLLALVLAGCAGNGLVAPPTAPAELGGTTAGITAADFQRRIGVLAHDSLRGRNTPHPGLESAARYLEAEYRRLGLQPAGEGGGFQQRYTVKGRNATAPNVVALLPGSDPALRGEYLILSAHFDHVGVGVPVAGDSIYNGADDNASGTAALLEVAEALAAQPQGPRRSIIFLHVSGEEKGLLGSYHYSENPTVPLSQVVANLNLDMIGRNSPDSVVVIGKEYSSLGAVVDGVAAAHPELGLVAADDQWPEERFFFRSDHYNFARKEIPALFFFTGVHDDYHRPSDEVERIDADKAARIGRLVLLTLQEIASSPERPQWDAAGLAEVRRMTRH